MQQCELAVFVVLLCSFYELFLQRTIIIFWRILWILTWNNAAGILTEGIYIDLNNCKAMELLYRFTTCRRQFCRCGLSSSGKLTTVLILCLLLGHEVAGVSFKSRLSKMLRGPSLHGRRVPRWDLDPETKLRIRRALSNTATNSEYDNGVQPSQDYDDYLSSDNCPEYTKYQIGDIYKSAYEGPVCDIIDARNSADQLKDLENCTIVNGFVHLVFMHDLTEEDLRKYRFPKLRVITDYLLVFRMFNIRTLRYMFPNLAVIGGRELFKDYALVLYENPDLKEVGLGNLQFINRGGVRMEKNPMLCYLHTISWERLGMHTKNTMLTTKKHFQDNREEDQCVDQCGDDANCDKENGRELCWGLNLCQKKRCPEACQDSCREDGSCGCHRQCLAGCSKPNDPRACVACRDKYYNGTCVGKCPAGTYLMFDWLCIEKEECQRLDWHFYENECRPDCPTKYKVNFTDCMRICTKCTSNCGKRCLDQTITDVESLDSVKDCTEIDGTLTININGGSEVVERLDEALKDLKVIGSLIVRRSFPLVTLSFLKNVKHITGNHMEQGIYSIYILENQNLKELWNFTEAKTTIGKGKAFFHFNPQLCLQEVHKVEKLTPETEDDKDISDTTNGDKAICVFVPIKVLKTQIYDEPLVKVQWENFEVKDDRTLIGYQVFYKESPEENAKKNEGTDACRLKSWTIVDKPKSEDGGGPPYPLETLSNETDIGPGITSKLLSHLKAYTKYAFYVQAYTTSTADSGAASEIQYFTTKPAKPSQPRNLRATGTTTSSINIEWDAPASPNGRITHYIVEWRRQAEEDLPSVRAIDTCRRGYTKPQHTSKPTPKPKTPSDASEPDNQPEKEKECTCECEKEIITQEREREAQESADFENYLQDSIFFAMTGPDSAVPGDFGGFDYDGIFPFPNEFGGNSSTRFRRSIVKRSADSINISSIVNATTAAKVVSFNVSTTVPPVEENVTTPIPEDPRFTKKRLIVNGSTTVTLTGLHHYSEYSIQVYACNHASDPRSSYDLTYNIKDEIAPAHPLFGPFDDMPKFTKCSIEAMSAKRTAANKSVDVIPPGSVMPLVQNKGMDEEVTTLYWKMPEDPNAYVKTFMIEVSYAENGNAIVPEICVHVNASVEDVMSYNFSRLTPGSYTAKIRPITLAGEGNWTKPVAFEVRDPLQSSHQTIIIVIIVVAVVIVACIIFVVVYLRTRKKPAGHSGEYADYNPDYARYVYIPDEYEIDIEKVTVLEEIGHGNFGKVFAGIAKSIVKDQEETKVAIKTLHENAPPARRFEFLKEASMMKAFNAHHVVRLLGVISKSVDPMVIMEFMEKGDLKSFLRSRRQDSEENSQHLPAPTLQEKLQMAAEIADGMAYLAAYKFVHRDLAGRNCLVDEQGTVKIGDFGLARDIYETDYYRKESRGFLPIRWMAPESLKDGIFDSRSDVWSYGVVLWELATLAEQPYQGQQHDEVTRFVIDGGYMEKPRNCPKRLYDLMTLCWQYNPKMRPTFIEIVQELYRDVNEEFKEVCFYGRHEQISVAEEDDGQYLLSHENSDGTEIIYPHNDVHQGPSLGVVYMDNNVLPPSWNAGDHSFKPQKNSGRLSSTPPKPENEEKLGLLSPEPHPMARNFDSPNTTSTTAPATPISINGPRTKRNRYSSESLYENDYEDDVRLTQSRDPTLRDSGAYITTSRNSKTGDKDPLVSYKHLNGGHKKSKDLDLDLESGVDEGMWGNSGNSSTASPSNPPTPTEMHAMLPPDGQNDQPVSALLRPTTASNC